MKIISEETLRNFNAWSGAKETQNRLIELNLESEFDSLIEELYPDGLTDTQLNDILWFESEWVFESLGVQEEEEENED